MGVRISDLTAMAEAVATGDLLPLVNVSESSDKTKKATIAQVRSAIVPIVEADQSLSDVTTLDVSTSKHGYVPKAPNDTAKFLRGDATWATPSGTAYDMLSTLTGAEISITGATTATISRVHVCSGTSSNYTVTLPAVSGNTGKFIGFRMASNLSKIVTIDGNGSETIDGLLTWKMWQYETLILLCDGSNWLRLAGKIRPMVCHICPGSSVSLSAGFQGVACDTTINDPTGQMAGSSRITIVRDGNYLVMGSVNFGKDASGNVFTTADPLLIASVTKNNTNGVTGRIGQTACGVSVNEAYIGNFMKLVYGLVAGDYLYLGARPTNACYAYADGTTLGTNFQAIEVPGWN